MASTHVDALQGSSVNILKANKVKLVEWFSSDLHIIQHAHADEIINDRVYTQLMAMQPEAACIKLIDTITLIGGEGTSYQFLKLLRKPEIHDTYPQLKEWNSSFALPDDRDDGETSGSAAVRRKEDLLVITEEDVKLYQKKFQTNVKDPSACLPEGSVQRTDREDFEFHTDISILHLDTVISNEHEIRQMERGKAWQKGEMVMKKAGQDFQLSDIYTHPSGKNKRIRTVMTIGNAGIGKTFLVLKLVSDWAKKEHQHPHLTFVFQFRYLNLLRGKEFTLAQLIHKCIYAAKCIPGEVLNVIFTKLQKSGTSDYDDSLFKLLFVFDGLDESTLRLRLNNKPTNGCSDDFSKPIPLEELLVNLMNGKLLRCALIWITTRPAAAKLIPSQFVDMFMEVKGFTDAKKVEYFRKRFSDEKLADRIISHVKTSTTFNSMCEIPVFCSLAATIFRDMRDERGQLPTTQTEMYSYFINVQTKRNKMKYDESHDVNQQQLMEKDRELLLKLGRLAFEHLEKGSIIFYQEHLEECGLDVKDASLYSGVCTEIFKEDTVQSERKVYSFVHLSIQEFLAAVYLFHCYTQRNVKVLTTFLEEEITLDVFLKKAFEKSTKSKNGHLDLFVRFLHGLSLQSNQSLLGGVLGQTQNSPESIQRAIDNLKKMTNTDGNLSPDRFINILHCLMEMNDHSLHQEIQQYLESGDRSKTKLTDSQCSALAHMLLTSEEVLDELDLDKYRTKGAWGKLGLFPAVRNTRKARLVGCDLNEPEYEIVSSALSSNPSHLRELDLSYNDVEDSFMELISAGLKSPHCELEILRLAGCHITQTGFDILLSALRSNLSHLRELDISFNCLQESQVEQLSALLKSAECRLQILRLSGCGLTEDGCSSLASALTFNPSHLKQLDLNFSHLGGSGLKKLSAALETLNVNHGGEHWIKPQLLTRYSHRLTLDSNTAHRELSLSENNRKATRVKQPHSYPDHHERFDRRPQVLCTEGLTGRCYWEVERSGGVRIAVTYRGISRKGEGEECLLGYNKMSWSLDCYDDNHVNRYNVTHNSKVTYLPDRPSDSNRVAVYLDCPAGTLSFYEVSSDTLTHLYTVQTTFTEPLYAGFTFDTDSSVSLCEDRQTDRL